MGGVVFGEVEVYIDDCWLCARDIWSSRESISVLSVVNIIVYT